MRIVKITAEGYVDEVIMLVDESAFMGEWMSRAREALNINHDATMLYDVILDEISEPFPMDINRPYLG